MFFSFRKLHNLPIVHSYWIDTSRRNHHEKVQVRSRMLRLLSIVATATGMFPSLASRPTNFHHPLSVYQQHLSTHRIYAMSRQVAIPPPPPQWVLDLDNPSSGKTKNTSISDPPGYNIPGFSKVGRDRASHTL